jgi:hypothetical protein
MALERNSNSWFLENSKGRAHSCQARFSMATFNLPYSGSNVSPFVPSAWEQFIRSAGVPERGCASLIANGTRKGSDIRSWVLANYSTRFVPEDILEVLGLQKQLAHRWQGEGQESTFSITKGEAR